MQKLIGILLNLLVENKWQFVDFEDVVSRYDRKEVDKVEGHLEALQEDGNIQYQREEYGFRILIRNMERVKKYKQFE